VGYVSSLEGKPICRDCAGAIILFNYCKFGRKVAAAQVTEPDLTRDFSGFQQVEGQNKAFFPSNFSKIP